MENLKDIIKEIITYKKMGLSKLSDDCILDCATRIFNSQNIQGKNFAKATSFRNPVSSPATKKQIEALKKHGFKGDISKLSKQEAYKIISEGVGK